MTISDVKGLCPNLYCVLRTERKEVKRHFLLKEWDFWVISKRRSLESIPWYLPVEGSSIALYYLRLSLPPANLSVHLWCWGEASCRNDVPVCKIITSICCSEELVSHTCGADISLGAQLSPTCSEQPSTQMPPTQVLRPSFPLNRKCRNTLE